MTQFMSTVGFRVISIPNNDPESTTLCQTMYCLINNFIKTMINSYAFGDENHVPRNGLLKIAVGMKDEIICGTDELKMNTRKK